jgi:hypothetical protein
MPLSFRAYDLRDALIGSYWTREAAQNAFLELYPSFHRPSVQHFITEEYLHFDKCPDTCYEGWVSAIKWKQGRRVLRLIDAIKYYRNVCGEETLFEAVHRTFKIRTGRVGKRRRPAPPPLPEKTPVWEI